MIALTALLLCGGILLAESAGPGGAIEDVKNLRKLMKHADSGFYATCKLVLFSELVDYDTAVARCQNFKIGMGEASKGNLATVDSSEKNQYIRALLTMAYPKKYGKWDSESWVWAGLQKVKNNSGKVKKVYNPEDWAWESNGDSPTFSSWMKRQPDQAVKKKGKGGCTQKKCYQNQMRINKKGAWDDTFKFKVHPYACDYQGKYIISANKAKWDSAKQQCENAGLILAQVRTEEEQTQIVAAAEYFLGKRIPGSGTFWASNWFWIGANDVEDHTQYVWTDGTKFDITQSWINWHKNQPDVAKFKTEDGQHYLAISKMGTWDDSYGEIRRRPFACMCPGT